MYYAVSTVLYFFWNGFSSVSSVTPSGRMEFTIPDNRFKYTIPDSRLKYTVTE